MSEKLDVIFLGTGGGTPSSRRYLPSAALRLGGRWLLFDAGEGVQMRLRESSLGWGGLQAIFISHLHGDHVLGLPGLLMSLGMAKMDAPLNLFGPPGLETLVQTVLTTCRVHLPFTLQIHTIESSGGVLLEASDFVVEAAPLKHRIPCFGFFWSEKGRPGRFFPDKAAALEVPPGPLYKQLQMGLAVTLPNGKVVQPGDVLGPSRPGRKVAYCTDTMPCEAAIIHGRGADLLIHDSTFGSGLEDEANLFGHSTSAQAAQQALAAGCRQLALTHFSARYEDIQPLLADAQAIFPNTIAARDLLEVTIPQRDE